MKVAYLSCRETLPNASHRRTDAFEHDLMMENLRKAFFENGATIDDIAWDDPTVEWREFDAAIIGTAWDYCNRSSEFLTTLETIETRTKLFNPSSMVVWNSHKSYLQALSDRGVATIPTVWVGEPTPKTVRDAFQRLDAEHLVFKRQIGANAEGQFRLRVGETPPPMPEPLMAQPFMASIQDEGEFSFIFVDGKLSHTVLKTAAKGDYRIQSDYGGAEKAVTPSDQDLEAANRVVSALDKAPLYARVDMVRGPDGVLLLMELELIEPFLYPQQGPELGARLYEALNRRL